MKLADLQRVTELQGALARLDEIPAGCALLEANGLDIELTADELAAFVNWRRSDLQGRLRELGVEIEDGARQKGDAYPEGTASPITMGDALKRVGKLLTPPALGEAGPARDYAAEAEAAVMAGPLEDLRRGLIPAEPEPYGVVSYAELKERRAPLIAAAIAELKRGEPAARCGCGAPATTQLGGVDYCEAHAAATPRRPRPAIFARLRGATA